MNDRILALTPILIMILLLCPTLLGQTVPSPSVAQVPPLPPRLPGGIPAFPGAWGGGMFTTGGRVAR